MGSRLNSIKDAIDALIDACIPVLRPHMVRFLNKVPDERQPGMVKGVWTTEIVDAYNREHAAEQVTKKYNLKKKLRPSYNCMVTRIKAGEINSDEEV